MSTPHSSRNRSENDNSRQGLVQLIPKGWGNFHSNNADPMKEGTSRHIGFTSSDSTDGLLSSFLALFAENCSSFSIIFTVKSIYLSSEKTEMLFGCSKFHTNQKDLIILQFYKHLCSFSKFKEIDCKDKIASSILKLWSVLGKHMLKTIVLAQTFDTGCVRRQKSIFDDKNKADIIFQG